MFNDVKTEPYTLFNIKMSYQDRESHGRDKSYLNGSSYPAQTAYLYWIIPQLLYLIM